MQLFTSIVSHKSLAGAARELGLSAAGATQRLKALEDRLGSPLLIRSTRAMSLTPAGEMFLAGCQRVLPEIDQLLSAISSKEGQVQGHLKIGAPVDLGHNHIRRLSDLFIEQNPGITIDLYLTDQTVDLFGQGLDFAFRYGLLNDSSLLARKLLDNWRTPCAAPSYLKQHGVPEMPTDLQKHNCLILLRDRSPMDRWPFASQEGIQEIKVSGDRAADDGELVRCWAVEGKGIAYKSYLDIADDVNNGRLVTLLDDFNVGGSPLSLLYPAHNRHLDRIKAFAEFAVHYFTRMQSQLNP